MNMNPLEVKAKQGQGNYTEIIIKIGSTVVGTRFDELIPCHFPIQTSQPVYVEIPPSGSKGSTSSFFAETAASSFPENDYPHSIRFPLYQRQENISLCHWEAFVSDASMALSQVPVIAIAAGALCLEADAVVRKYSVLPVWNDTSSVLVRLAVMQNQLSEASLNPPWQMTVSEGMPLCMGMEQFENNLAAADGNPQSPFELHFTPWLLGARLLGSEGKPIAHRVSQRAWTFDSAEEFFAALRRITGSLRGTVLPKDAA